MYIYEKKCVFRITINIKHTIGVNMLKNVKSYEKGFPLQKEPLSWPFLKITQGLFLDRELQMIIFAISIYTLINNVFELIVH